MEKIKKPGKKHSKTRETVKSSDIKRQKAIGYFDRCCFLLFLVLLGAFLVCYGKPYELQEAVSHGHAVWFLLLFAYPILGFLGLVNVLLGTADAPIMRYFTIDNPILGLILADITYLFLLWLIIRRRGLTWFGSNGMRAAGNFVLIVAFWGVFQLFLSGIMFLWNSGGMTPFHPHDPPAAAAPADPGAAADNPALPPVTPAIPNSRP